MVGGLYTYDTGRPPPQPSEKTLYNKSEHSQKDMPAASPRGIVYLSCYPSVGMPINIGALGIEPITVYAGRRCPSADVLAIAERIVDVGGVAEVGNVYPPLDFQRAFAKGLLERLIFGIDFLQPSENCFLKFRLRKLLDFAQHDRVAAKGIDARAHLC